MADSEQIKRVDVIAADVFTQPAEEAKILLDQINLVVKGMKEMLAVSSKDLSITTTKDAAEVAKMAAQIKDLEDKIKLLNTVQEKQKAVQKELTIEQAKANIERQKQRQAVTEQAKQESVLTSAYEKQVTRLAQVKRELKDLAVQGKKAPQALADEFKKLDDSVQSAERGVKEFQRNVGNYTSATQELKALTKQLVDLELAGQRDTKAFRDMSARAGELKDTIGDVKAQINNLASDTKTIDGVVGSVSLLAGAFETAEGAAVLLGGSSEDWKEEMVRLQAVMAVANGIQQVQNALQKESAAMMFLNSIRTKAAVITQELYTFVTGKATVATTGFKVALASTGIGLVVVAVGALAYAFSNLGDEVEDETKKQERLNDALQKTDDIRKKSIKVWDLQRNASKGGLDDLNRELFAMKEKGATAKAIFDQEQKIRREELNALELQKEIRFSQIKEQEKFKDEYLQIQKEILDKKNEIDNTRLKEEKTKQKKAIVDGLAMNEDAEEQELQRKEKLADDLAAEKQREIDEKTAMEEAYQQWLREQEFAAAEIEKAKNKADAIARKEAIKQQQRQQTDQIISGAKEGVERREEIIQSGIQKELTQTERAIERQQELASKGLENTLAFQEKRRAELEAKAVREKAAAQKKEEAIQLAGAYLSAYRARMDKGNQSSTAALTGALSDVLLAKAISSSVAGAFAEGVEDFQGKGTGTSDSNLIAFSHGESVVTAKATKQYSGLVTAMNKGLVDDYVNEMIMPDLDARPSQNGNSFQSAAIIYALNTKLDSLEKAIKNKQEIKVNWDAQGARVEEIVKDGMRTVTKHVTTGKRRL